MDAAMKKALLDVHNRLRNDLALGKIEHYDPAANMATIQWDDGLAAKAALNVRQCELRSDGCRATGKRPTKSVQFSACFNISHYLDCHQLWWILDQFPEAGQNLAMYMTTGAAPKSPDNIAQMAASWFDAQKNGGPYGWMDMINTFTTVGQGWASLCFHETIQFRWILKWFYCFLIFFTEITRSVFSLNSCGANATKWVNFYYFSSAIWP